MFVSNPFNVSVCLFVCFLYEGVYDDEDLGEDGLFLLVCPQAPHYLWVGLHFHPLHELKGLDQGLGLGQDAAPRSSSNNNSLIPFSSARNRRDTEISESGQELGGGEEVDNDEGGDDDGVTVSDQAMVSWACRHVLRGRPTTPHSVYFIHTPSSIIYSTHTSSRFLSLTFFLIACRRFA